MRFGRSFPSAHLAAAAIVDNLTHTQKQADTRAARTRKELRGLFGDLPGLEVGMDPRGATITLENPPEGIWRSVFSGTGILAPDFKR